MDWNVPGSVFGKVVIVAVSVDHSCPFDKGFPTFPTLLFASGFVRAPGTAGTPDMRRGRLLERPMIAAYDPQLFTCSSESGFRVVVAVTVSGVRPAFERRRGPLDSATILLQPRASGTVRTFPMDIRSLIEGTVDMADDGDRNLVQLINDLRVVVSITMSAEESGNNLLCRQLLRLYRAHPAPTAIQDSRRPRLPFVSLTTSPPERTFDPSIFG